jgi:hypothetical protein
VSSIIQAPTEVDLRGVAGNPYALLLDFTSIKDGSGASIPWSSCSGFEATTFNGHGAILVSATPTVTNEGTYQVYVSWSESQTALMGTTGAWAFSMTIAGAGPLTLVSGSMDMFPMGTPGVSSAESVFGQTVVGQSTVNVTVQFEGSVVGAGVTTFNGRAGSITLASSDVEGLFASAGQLFVGTGAGTGELLASGAASYVLTSGGPGVVPTWSPSSGGGGGGGGGGGAVGLPVFNVQASPYNAVGDGVNDDTTAIEAANTAAHIMGGWVYFPPGFYKHSTGVFAVTQPNVDWIGCNSNSVKLQPYGSGDAIRWHNSPFNLSTSGPTSGPWGANGGGVQSGKLTGITIDGTNASAGATGLHYGDCINGAWEDLAVWNFDGAGSTGIVLDNNTNYTEGLWWGRVNCGNNTTNVKFTVTGGTPSFGYHRMKGLRLCAINGGQVGIEMDSGALLYNSEVNFEANLAGVSSGTQALLVKMVGATSGQQTGMANNMYRISAEQTAGAAATSKGFTFSNGAFVSGFGLIDLSSNSIQTITTGGELNVNGWIKMPGYTLSTPSGAGMQVNGISFIGQNSPVAGETGLSESASGNELNLFANNEIALFPSGVGSTAGGITLANSGELTSTQPVASTATAGAIASPGSFLGFITQVLTISGTPTTVKIPYFAV